MKRKLPRPIDYPVYSEAEKEQALLAVIRFVLSLPEERLKQPNKQQKRKGE